MTKLKNEETALNKAHVGRSVYKYFLEHKNLSGQWLTEKPDEIMKAHTLTKDPLKAMSFDTIGAAKIYLHLNNQDGALIDFYVTEHEFI